MARILAIQFDKPTDMKNQKISFFKFPLLAILSTAMLCLLAISCKKDKIASKEITYEITGNFGKTVNVKYTPTDGTIANAEENVTLPWKKTVVPNAKNASVGLTVKGDNGTPGAQIFAKVFVNGVEARVVAMQADAKGDFVIKID